MKTTQFLTICGVAAFLLAGCSGTTGQSSAPATSSHSATTGTPATSGATSQPAANPYPIPSATTSITGSGSTFVKPLVDAWAIGFNGEHGSVQVGYNGGGSGTGISNIKDRLVQFAGSDAPLTSADYPAASGVLQFPDTIGPVAVVYNVDGVGDHVQLTGDIIGKIFDGDIKFWDDAAIKAENSAIAGTLPHSGIGIVYRSDSSGTTFVFTDYLSKVSPSWQAKMGTTATKKPNWQNSGAAGPGGQSGNDGVASTVKSIPNSIGYVDLAYVQKLSLHAAAVKNSAGQYMPPTTDGAGKAAAAFADNLPQPEGDWSKVSIVNAPGDGAYPIATFSYILVFSSLSAYNGHATADQLNGLKAWLHWDLHEGQVDYPETLGYAPLPAKVVAIGDKALTMITV